MTEATHILHYTIEPPHRLPAMAIIAVAAVLVYPRRKSASRGVECAALAEL